jgi:trehalose 6-phosphate synthase/phosphatase
MKKLVIVSNRLPIKVSQKKGRLVYQSSVGGLATGLASFYENKSSLWIGWPGAAKHKLKAREKQLKKKLKQKNCSPVLLTAKQVKNFYQGFCNKTIWPLFQYFPQYTIFKKKLWQSYQEVNELYARQVLKHLKPADDLWIHDYQLMLLPKLIRERMPEANIGFFLHIPFPSFEVFRLLPWRKQILKGLLGADLVGFHTFDYVRHFLNSVHGLFGYEHVLGQIQTGSRIVKADSFPMGIDYKKFSQAGSKKEVKKEIRKIKTRTGNKKIILSVDRLDYTKGILKRLEAFDRFLAKNKNYKGRVILILVAVPSRTRVEQYKQLKEQVDQAVGRINGKYGSINWMPIWYLYKSLPFKRLAAFYNIADVALVTPIRDGMNLIAKEYIVSKQDKKGVLVLSEMAGAAKELGEALIVNPNNKDSVSSALKQALKMPLKEQKERNEIMQQRLKRYTAAKWAKDFIDSLRKTKKAQNLLSSKRFTDDDKRNMFNDYILSSKRLLLLDYDGTLIGFKKNPKKTGPGSQLKQLLKTLTDKDKDQVVLISGRSKDMLDKWFLNPALGLIAEHGVFLKQKAKDWQTIKKINSDWKKEIRPVLESYVDRTPGSFIEEKDYSLAWHYRKADTRLAFIRVKELKENLRHLLANLELGILEGSRVVEIKNAGISKGRAVQHWLKKISSKNKKPFLLAIGDDKTDEDMFEVLKELKNEKIYTIKVGLEASQAKYSLADHKEVRGLLKELANL